MLTGKEVTKSSLTGSVAVLHCRVVSNLFKSSNKLRNTDLNTFKTLFNML